MDTVSAHKPNVRELKAELGRLGVDHSQCLERSELEGLLAKHGGSKGTVQVLKPPRCTGSAIQNPGHGILLQAVIGSLAQIGTSVSLRTAQALPNNVLAIQDDPAKALLAIEDAVACIGQLALCDDVALQRAADYQASASAGCACRVLALPAGKQVGTDANTPLLAYRAHVAAISDDASEDDFFEAYYGNNRRLFHQLDLHMEMFDDLWDYDFSCSPFTDAGYDDGEHKRGGVSYLRPLGWKRFALNVESKFEKPAAWLNDKGEGGEWAVAYHGTTSFSVRPIAREGLRNDVTRTHGALYGEGIYCAPHPEVAAFFAKPVPIDEAGEKHYFQVVFQCRVRPGSYHKHQDPLGEFWVVPSEADVRPYGMLLSECDEIGLSLCQVRCDAGDNMHDFTT